MSKLTYDDLPEWVRDHYPGYSIQWSESPNVYHRAIFTEDEILIGTVMAGEAFDTPLSERYTETRIQRPKPTELEPVSDEDYLDYLKREYLESVESGDVSDMRESALALADFICETERN